MQNYSDTWNFNEIPYYKLNKVLLLAIGQWPAQNTKCGRIQRTFICTALLSLFVALVSKLFTTPISVDLITHVIPRTFVLMGCTIKVYNHTYNKAGMEALLNHIKIDWKQIKLSNEVRVMQKYGQDAKRYAIIYTLWIYISSVAFFCISLLPPILDVLAPLNKSRSRHQPVEAEYFVNPERYFYLIFCYLCFVGSIILTIVVAIDTIFIIYVQHACGLFAVTGVRLECILYDKKGYIHKNENSLDNLGRQKIAYCVEIHKKAMEFAALIEASFTWSLLAQMLLNVISMSITLVRVCFPCSAQIVVEMLITFLNEFEEIVRNTLFVIAQLFHVFVNSYPGQKLMDHSTYITVAAYNGKWYNMSAKLQKSLLLIIRRGMEPTLLTAGKICVLSLTTFSKIVQSTVSYFTVLCSVL